MINIDQVDKMMIKAIKISKLVEGASTLAFLHCDSPEGKYTADCKLYSEHASEKAKSIVNIYDTYEDAMKDIDEIFQKYPGKEPPIIIIDDIPRTENADLRSEADGQKDDEIFHAGRD